MSTENQKSIRFEYLESRTLFAAAPPTPVGVDAELIAPRAVRVSWNDVEGETGYRVERRVDGSSDPWAVVARPAANVVSITNDGLLLGRTYLYRVVAFNEAGESAPSAVDFVATPRESDLPPVPTGPAATLVGPRAIKLTWNDVAGDSTYVVERRIDGTSEPWARVGSTNAGVTTFTDEGLLAGKTYLYRVRAVNAVGPSAPSNVAFAATPPEGGITVPPAPRELNASLVDPRAARITWADVAGETGYRVQRRVDGSADEWTTVGTVGENLTTFVNEGLAAGKTYLYRVRAFNAAGTSAPSNVDSVTTAAETPRVPSAPHLETSLVAPRAVRLAWTNVSNEGGYKVERRVDGTDQPFRQIAVIADEVTRYVDDGLEPGKTYIYRVRAFNSAGNSAYSNTAARTIPGEVAVPAAPRELTAHATAPRVIELRWSNVANESGYKVERRLDGTDGWDQVGTTAANVTTFRDERVEPGQAYVYRVGAFNGAGNSPYSNRAAATTPRSNPVVGTGNGLLGTYFDNADLTNPRLTRVDSTVNFEWGEGSPALAIDANSFSVRWTGQVQAQFTETYRFYTRSDDGVRLWVDGKLLIDDWNHHPATERAESIALEAGKKYSIRLEYFDSTGAALARLMWSSPSTEKQVIPKAQLYADEA